MSSQNSNSASDNYAAIKKYISIAMGAFYIFIGAMLLITKRLLWESRPFFTLPSPFLCAISYAI